MQEDGESVPSKLYRVVLIGDTEVGKTSIARRYIHGTFDNDTNATIGAVFEKITKTVNKIDITIQICDTAGQEKYRSLGPVYYRDSQAAIAVFDASKLSSMHSLNEWIETFKKSTEEAFVVIAANKIDKLSRNDFGSIQSTAKNFADRIETPIFFTSAKTGQGIDDLMGFLFERFSTYKSFLSAGGSLTLEGSSPVLYNCC